MTYLLFFLAFFSTNLFGQKECLAITRITTSIANQLDSDLISRNINTPSIDSSLLYKSSTQWRLQPEKVDLQMFRFDSASSTNISIKQNANWLLNLLNIDSIPPPPPPPPLPPQFHYGFKIIYPKFLGICSDINTIGDIKSCLQKEVEEQVCMKLKNPKEVNLLKLGDTVIVNYLIEKDGSIKEINSCIADNELLILPVIKALKKVKLNLKWEEKAKRNMFRFEMNHTLKIKFPASPKKSIFLVEPKP